MDNSTSRLVRLLGEGSQYPIFDNLCRHLDAIDIVRLTRTCRDLSDIYRRLLKTHWNINRRLKWFVDDPHSFRSQLGEVDALISGGFALQFFDRALWEESDLDVYIQAEKESNSNFEGLINYLICHEGYQVTRRYVEDGSYNGDKSFEGIAEIIDLTRKDHRKIQLLRCRHAPIKVILGGFYATTVLNVITWDAAYCLFPYLTFTKRRLELLQEYRSRHRLLIQKYERRGWTLGQGPTYSYFWSKFNFTTGFGKNKLLADASTWKIAFNTDTVPVPAPSTRDLEFTHISLNINEKEGGVPGVDAMSHYSITAPVPFVSMGLRKEYFYGDPRWANWLARKLHPRIKQELARLDEASRPPFYEEVMFKSQKKKRTYPRRWRPLSLSSWRFYDEMIPEWFEDYKEAIR